MSQDEGRQPWIQNVVAVDGVAYGAIGAQVHVFGGSGVPLYLLANWRLPARADQAWLRELPSRMLNARFAVVDFTGRAGELQELHHWRDAGQRLQLRWLHGPGGQGKTRLAEQLAKDSVRAGWKVITATHGPGGVLEPLGSQDLRPGDAVGRLVIVDYADRWPLTHLTWLLSNSMFHDAAPARVLLLARTADAWPALSAAVANLQAGVSSRFLDPLPRESSHRGEMFSAARTAFARRYGLTDSSGIGPPGSLDHPELGLTLAVHMAALVAIDAHVHGGLPPKDMAGLAVYLLNREHLHWARLYDEGAGPELRLDPADQRFFTPPQVMNQVVYTGALTGPVTRPAAIALLERLSTGHNAEQLVTDHATCYPSGDHAMALEPLYPDRLAEDFLALTMPGHPADYPAQLWAPGTTSTLLTRLSDGGPPALYTPRAITFLATAAQRWPHLGERYLHPLLREDPQLAIDAGSAALTALAAGETVDLSVLESIEVRFPFPRSVDLDIGIAAVVTRLAEHRLATTTDPAGRARIHFNLCFKLSNAGQFDRALAESHHALHIRQELAASNRAAHLPDLAESLTDYAIRLSEVGRREEALPVSEEALALVRELAASNRAAHLSRLLDSLTSYAIRLSEVGRREEALSFSEEALALVRELAASNRAASLPSLATCLSNHVNRLAQEGRREEALSFSEEALTLRRELAASNRAAYLPGLATSLMIHGIQLSEVGRREEALSFSEEALTLRRELAASNRAAHLLGLATTLTSLALRLSEVGRREEAIHISQQAVEANQELVAVNRAAHLIGLAGALNNHAIQFADMGRWEEAFRVSEAGLDAWQELATVNRRAHLPNLAGSLSSYARRLADAGRWEEALPFSEEALTLRRELAASNRAAHLPGLATSLLNQACHLADVERQEEAVLICQEAVDAYQELAAVNQAVYLEDYSRSLTIMEMLVNDSMEMLVNDSGPVGDDMSRFSWSLVDGKLTKQQRPEP
ncbi:tetratricopeptide repeat protein [Streptomyces sp. NPDC086033]|uniref:tetratricopeptide repeat protein n=1 Tax=Streptomyces sp. NPDC086033 TaxID=3365747 RepID=UPI0037D506C6